jgi:hypothetical protein
MMRGGKLDSCRSGHGQVAGCCEHGNEHKSFIKYAKFLKQLRDFFSSEERPFRQI